MDDKQKVLFCGDVEGRFDMLFKRVKSINEKNGPFDMLFCLGNFFGVNNKELLPYKKGEKIIPIPTYILGPNSPDKVELYERKDLDMCDNLFYLGKRGLFRSTKGLKIAYISGMYGKISNNFQYSDNDIDELFAACIRGNPNFRGIDVLLTSQWSENIINNSTAKIDLTINKTSVSSAWLTLKLKPRYHICGIEGIFYERPPFRCPNLDDNDNTVNVATRFVGLGRVGNPSKEKWIYALRLKALEKMQITEIVQKTTDETECPFNVLEIQKKLYHYNKRQLPTDQFFYDIEAAHEKQKNKNHGKKQKLEFNNDNCWFCLSSPNVENHLIISIGDFSYLALAKGGVVEDHLLICPIDHYSNNLIQPEEGQMEIEQFKESLRNYFNRKEKIPIFFERNYKTFHMQIQVVPIPNNIHKNLENLFMDHAIANKLELKVLEQHNDLNQELDSNNPYFVVELSKENILYTKIQGNELSLNFGRDVLVSKDVLNLPNNIEWKKCVLGKEKEENLVKVIRDEFKPFDFTK